jgi:uncharacterized protein
MLQRDAAQALQQLAKHYPVVAVTGPRQSGKTTLVRHLFPDKPYVSLENPDQQEFIHDDPRGFLSQFPAGAIFDEAQRCPQLFSYLQGIVDDTRQPGQFVLTGSQQFGLLAGITQSLAGRVGIVQLLPFSLNELQVAKQLPDSLERLLFRGCYPPVYDRAIPATNWYSNYIMTYIERDVRQLINVHDLQVFQRFVKMCAARTGQLLNLSSLANDCGITHNTAKAWLSVLEASYIIFLLPPHHANFNKRLIKSPKLHFIDTGLACSLLGIQNFEQLLIHPIRGALFETWVTSELLKIRYNAGLSSHLYFWRDSQGHEIDILIEQGDQLIPIEIKAGQTITTDYLAGLQKWLQIAGLPSSHPAWLVYAGKAEQKRTLCRIIGWENVKAILAT